MKSRLLLFPFLAPLMLLGIICALLGQTKNDTARAKLTKLSSA